jgi:adenylate kinase
MKTIITSGSVGSGKTYVSKKLAKPLKYEYLDLNKVIKENELEESYDKKNQCYVVDIKKLNKILIKIIKESKKNLIIDSHLSHYLPKKYVNLCIITTCDIEILSKRLKKRKYSKSKIKNNLEVEIFNTCLLEAKEKKHNILVLDTTKRSNLKEVISYIKKLATLK